VIVLDVMMPVLDGLGFLDRRAADPVVAEIPVVLLSAVVETLDRAALSAEVVLGKPIDLDLLIGAIRSVAGTPARGLRRTPRAAG
jgi:CheY-like chemotaxis protein